MDKSLGQLLENLENSRIQTRDSLYNIFQDFERIGCIYSQYIGTPSLDNSHINSADPLAHSTESHGTRSTLLLNPPSDAAIKNIFDNYYNDEDEDDEDGECPTNIMDGAGDLAVVCSVDNVPRAQDPRNLTDPTYDPVAGDAAYVPDSSVRDHGDLTGLSIVPWNEGVVVDVHRDDSSLPGSPNTEYLVRVRDLAEPRWYGTHEVAPVKPFQAQTPTAANLPVGSRVVSTHPCLPDTSAACTVLEQPSLVNRQRYLVIFDDWIVKYTAGTEAHHHHHNSDPDIRPVLSCLRAMVGTAPAPPLGFGITTNARHFIRSYVERYPERALVHLRVGQVVNVRYDNGWIPAKVEQVDASLARFVAVPRLPIPAGSPIIGNDGWLYRGSYRLEPLYKEIKHNTKHVTQHHKVHRPRHSHVARERRFDAPYVEYEYVPHISSRATTDPLPRVETAHRRPSSTTNIFDNFLSSGSAIRGDVSLISSLEMPAPALRTVGEDAQERATSDGMTTGLVGSVPDFPCDSSCQTSLVRGENMAANVYWNVNYYADLARPILSGWERKVDHHMTDHVQLTSNCYYVSPCRNHSTSSGVMIADASTLVAYLSATGSTLTVDLFDFEPALVVNLSPLSSFPCFVPGTPQHSHLVYGDISDGAERFPLPCVNELYGDVTLPEPFVYDTSRLAAPGVYMTLDPEFLTCCDCEDGACLDAQACACQRLTSSSVKVSHRSGSDTEDGTKDVADHDRDDSRLRGYVNKRLPRQIVSGIYECNSRCPCDRTRCVNRVAQRGFGGARLQVYKDRDKGWCVRTLDDLPKGAFVSIYSGYILTEEISDAFGIASEDADEYFAELDFIECAENEDGSSSSEDDDDEDDTGSSCKQESLINDQESSDASNEDPSAHKNLTNLKKRPKAWHEPDASAQAKNISGSLDDNIFDSLQRFLFTESSDPTRSENRFDDAGSDLPNRSRPDHPDRNMTRLFCSDQTGIFILDAKRRGNVGRYYSHSCDPNMFVQNVFVDTHNLCLPWIAFFTSRLVPAMTELTWDYMYEVNSTGKVIVCKCYSSNCRGRLL